MSNTDYCSEMGLSPPTSVDNSADQCIVDNDENYYNDAFFNDLDVATNDLNRDLITDQHDAFYSLPAATLEDDAGFALMSHLLLITSSMTAAIGAPTGSGQHNLLNSVPTTTIAPTAISSSSPSIFSITPTSTPPVSVIHEQNDSNTAENPVLSYSVPFIAPEDILRQRQHTLHREGQLPPPATVIATLSSPIVPTTTSLPLAKNEQEVQAARKIAIKPETSRSQKVVPILERGGTVERTKEMREHERKTQTQQSKQVAAAKKNDVDKEERRQKRLLRNRLAAKECREKKRQHQESLEKRVVQLEEENERLRESVDRLKDRLTLCLQNPNDFYHHSRYSLAAT
ncbi:hypothetical protein BDB00DRAFT_860009 [Zychaea mexicana]|uniref:uncharacterized protein n=1 Tax=Zychaea mexicana TaxID=64656 RepID=UPI0022FE2012|nr:uncharacterized protein BDB00DRAFT_860009 [Zychaea mexicana]KAI9475363.1 hypothetical protein BDB00DRAFT_860009 [Zychaea mexicana]